MSTTPGQALSDRQRLETRTERAFLGLLSGVCAEVKDQALSALKGTVLTAASDPFAYTNVLATWRAATKDLAERRADLVPSQVEELLAASALPSMMHQDTVDLLRTAQEQGWSTYKTRVELGRLLTPRPASRTDDEYRAKHEVYKNAVRREARTAATYNYNSQALSDITEPYKMWVSRLDAKTRPAHLEANGQVVPTSAEFVVGNERLMHPGDWNGSAAQTYNCRCVVVGRATLSDMSLATAPLHTSTAPSITASGYEVEEAPAEPRTSAQWEGFIGFENEMTGDGRIIELEALTWETPLPLRYVVEDEGAHDGAVVVGRILTVERRDGGALWSTGDFDLDSELGREAFRQVDEELTNGVSMDLDSIAFEIRVASDLLTDEAGEAEPVLDEDGRVTVAKMGADDEVMVTTAGRIRAATIVAIPAFANARLHTVKEDDGDAQGDGAGAEPMAGQLANDGEPAEPVLAQVSASGASPLSAHRPPRAWFENPGFTQRQPLRVEDDGRVYGHLAEWDSCHTSFTAMGQCVLAPHSASDYAYFKTGYVVTKEGDEIPVGRLTAGTGHAKEHLDAQATLAHYDNTGHSTAVVNIGEDAIGIWVAGALLPGVSEQQKVVLRTAPLSGDWRWINGSLDLVAALAVNTAGFAIPRPKGLVAGGHLRTLIAAGMVAPEQVLPPEHPDALSVSDLRYLKAIVRRERESREARVHALALARRVERSR